MIIYEIDPYTQFRLEIRTVTGLKAKFGFESIPSLSNGIDLN
jgi:hypothetical protein